MTWNPQHRLVTTKEAAKSVDRPPSTIRRWISEGRLRPRAKLNGADGRPINLYLEADVLKVEAETHRNTHRAVKPTPRIEDTPASA